MNYKLCVLSRNAKHFLFNGIFSQTFLQDFDENKTDLPQHVRFVLYVAKFLRLPVIRY